MASERESISPFDIDEDEQPVCEHCGASPCEWQQYGEDALEVISFKFIPVEEPQYLGNDGHVLYYTRATDGATVDLKAVRNAVYRMFTYMKYGHLGKGNRIPIPPCVIQQIRDEYPEPEGGKYTGFQAASSAEEA